MSVSIKRDRATGKNLGYGFVKMSSHQEARGAKEAMQNVELGGRRVRVGWAQKNTSLFVGGLDPGITTQMLIAEFARFGPLDKELTAIKPGAKGGFVKYRYRLHAETAKMELNNRPAFGGQCPSLQIEWNSVESGPDGSEAAGSTDGNASDKPAGREGDMSSSRSSSSSRPSRTSDGSAANAVRVQFEGEQSAVSGVNEAMIKKTFASWEPILNVVIPSSRFNGVSPGPQQLPRCWGFVHFPPTPQGEQAAKDAIQALTGTTISGMKVHCTMSPSSSGHGQGGKATAGGWRKDMGLGGGRSRRAGGDRHGDDRHMHHGGGPGFGNRQGRSSLDSPHGGRGGWGGNAGMRHNNASMHHRHHSLHPFHSQQSPQNHTAPHHAATGHAPHLLQQHPHQPHAQHAPQHHQQQMYGYGAATGGASAGYAGQYVVPGAAPAAPGAGGEAATGAQGPTGAAGDMMMQNPYGMAPYPYMYQGMPYANTAAQGYPMGYQQMYGYPYQQSPGMAMDPSMMQGQMAGVPVVPQQPQPQQQAGGAAGAPPQQQAQPSTMHQNPAHGQGAVQLPQQQVQQNQQHMGTQRQPPSQVQTQQQVQARAASQQRQMGMQPMMMQGTGNPSGLNVGVPTYMPIYQLPQMPPGGAGVPDASTDQDDGKHGE